MSRVRCSGCGRFMHRADIEIIYVPDSNFTIERIETIHEVCKNPDRTEVTA